MTVSSNPAPGAAADAAAGSPSPGSLPLADAGDDWVGLVEHDLPVHEALLWAVTPSCGAVVTFTGTVRDHSEGRPGVETLYYEAYAEQVEPRLAAVARAARERWPDIGRVALLHRIGLLHVSEAAVVVAVSTPNRPAAFEAARYCIDTVKATVPIWKRETWRGGEDWGTCDHDIVTLGTAERGSTADLDGSAEGGSAARARADGKVGASPTDRLASP